VRIPHTMVQVQTRAALRRIMKENERKTKLEQHRVQVLSELDDAKARLEATKKKAEALAKLSATFGEVAKKTREFVEANKKKRTRR
jgi:hypothetical protein